MRRTTWVAGGMLVAAVAVGGAANLIEDNFLATGWVTVHHGEQARDSSVGNFQVHVHGARASARLQDDTVVTSPGTFVVVDLAYATTDAWDAAEEVVLTDARWREFSEPTWFGSDGRVWEAGPDIWIRGTLLFELPTDAVGELTLQFRPEIVDARLPAQLLQIPLSVDTVSEPVALERPTVLAKGER